MTESTSASGTNDASPASPAAPDPASAAPTESSGQASPRKRAAKRQPGSTTDRPRKVTGSATRAANAASARKSAASARSARSVSTPRSRPQPAAGRGTVRKVTEIALLPVSVASKALPKAGGVPYYASLGALAVAGVIEWPVAAVVGAGYLLARREIRRREADRGAALSR